MSRNQEAENTLRAYIDQTEHALRCASLDVDLLVEALARIATGGCEHLRVNHDPQRCPGTKRPSGSPCAPCQATIALATYRGDEES